MNGLACGGEVTMATGDLIAYRTDIAQGKDALSKHIALWPLTRSSLVRDSNSSTQRARHSAATDGLTA
jgi:hypothetical protein